MKRRLLLLLPLLSCTLLTWQPFALDERVTVELPAQPTEAHAAPGKKVGRTRAWQLHTADGVYHILRQPTGLVRAEEATRNACYEGLISATLRAEQGQLVLITAFPTDAGPSLEYKYRVVRRGTHQHLTKIARVLVVDSVAYSLQFIPADPRDSLGVAGAAQRTRFYNSLTVQH
jgi:hypothetical protein